MSVSLEAKSGAVRPTVVFVFGMGRSGSSALARVLSLCGCGLPAELVGATEANPLGHWEPHDALSLNEAFLAAHGASWFDPTLRLQAEAAVDTQQGAAFIEMIKEFLRSVPSAPLTVIKEPRITALSEYWFAAVRELGFAVGVVIPVRHPEEVVASLKVRDGASPELSSALWLKYNLLGERQSRGAPRVFVDYLSLLTDWRAEVSRISAALSIDLSGRDESTIEEFLRHDLRRQRHSGGVTEIFGQPWLSRVYAAFSAAARDEPLDTEGLDEIFEAYRTHERAFRVALQDFAGRRDPAPAVPARGDVRNPDLARLICAVAGRDSKVLRQSLNDQWYILRNADVIAARLDPFEHWLAYGANEGRMPCQDTLTLLESLMKERTSVDSIGARQTIST
jgi:hypothetical protein